MSETNTPTPAVQPVGVPTPEQTVIHAEQDFTAGVQRVLARERNEIAAEVLAALEAASKPNRSRIPGITAPTPETNRAEAEAWVTRQERFGYGDVRDMTDYLYSTLPTYARKIRNPRSDEMMRQFLCGLRWRNHEVVDRSYRALNDMYRATTLEGDSSLKAGGTPGTGEPFLPLPIANLVILARDKAAKIRARATRFTSNSQTISVPVATVATAGMALEGAVASVGEPTLTRKLLTKHKAQARFIASDEMLEDSAFNLVSFFTERAGSALGALEDDQFCKSNGTAPNIGQSLESATITEVTESVSGTLKYVDVVKLFFSIPEQYRVQGLYWLGNSLMMQILSQIVDGNGRPIFTPYMGPPGTVTSEAPAGNVGTIFGAPVLEVPLTTTSSPTATRLMLGVLSNYGYLDGGGMTVRVSEHTGWATDTVNFKITERIDGAVLLEDSFREMLAITQAG